MDYKTYQEYINKAFIEYKNQNINHALTFLLEAEKIYRDEDLLIDIALLYDELTEYQNAKIYYFKVLELDITDARAYYGLGIISESLKEYEEAKAYYKEAINYDNDYFEAHFFLANIYDDEKMTSLAIYHYKRVIEINPDYFYAYLNLGAAYENLNENEVALEYLLKASEINDNNHLLHFNFGVVYRKLNQIGSAISSYQKSLEISTNHAFSFLNLAIIYKDDLNDIKKAIETYTTGISIHQEEAVLYYNRGCAYALLNEYPKALEDLKHAVHLEASLLEYLLLDEELHKLHETQDFKQIFLHN